MPELVRYSDVTCDLLSTDLVLILQACAVICDLVSGILDLVIWDLGSCDLVTGAKLRV